MVKYPTLNQALAGYGLFARRPEDLGQIPRNPDERIIVDRAGQVVLMASTARDAWDYVHKLERR